MPVRGAITAGWAVVALAVLGLHQASAQTIPADVQEKHAKTLIAKITECLTGTAFPEALLLKDAVKCVRYRQSMEELAKEKSDTPFDVPHEEICASEADQRRVPPDLIKLLAKQKTDIAPTGIRIVGAVFCETLDLVGLDVPYSIVLDRSLFARGIMARNFRTKADFSVDDSMVFGSFWLVRARIEGTVFASGTFVRNLHVLETEIVKSLLFRNSVLSGIVEFDNLTLSGELSVRGSALSRLLVQSSRIGGVVDLTDSEARCAYHIKASDIGSLVAVNMGLGSVDTARGANERGPMYAWRRLVNASEPPGPIKRILERPAVSQRVGESEDCRCRTPDCSSKYSRFKPEFLLLDNRVRSSLCLRHFNWLVSSDNATSYFTLNDLNVGRSIVMNLWKDGGGAQTPERARRFEILGVESRNLIADFTEGQRSYSLLVDGLRFERVYSGKVQCEYHPATSIQGAEFTSEERSELRLPRVAEVIAWLSKDPRPTSQPLTAFVEAYQRAGDGASATELRIERATRELWTNARRWWASRKAPSDPNPVTVVEAQSSSKDAAWSLRNWVNFVWAGIVLFFQWVMWLVAPWLSTRSSPVDFVVRPGRFWDVFLDRSAYCRFRA
jgi:hypothetical protein